MTRLDTPEIARERASTTFTPSFDVSASDRDDLAFYLGSIRRRLRIVIAVPVLFGLAAAGISLLRPREYTASAAFLATEPNAASGSLGSLGSIATQLGIPALSAIASNSATVGPQFYGDLLSSNALLHSLVMTRFDAPAPGEYGGKAFTGTLVEYFDGDGKTPDDREVDAMRRFTRRAFTVAVDRPTGVVRFQIRTKNRALSALIARRMLDLVNDFNLRRRQTQAGNERDFAARRAASALDSLRAAERVLADFKASNIDFSRSPRLGERETELQRRVTLAQQIYTTIAQRYETSNLEAVRNTPVITVLDAPEGLVESRPRYTIAIAAAAFFVGLVIAVIIAIRLETSAARHEDRL
jgi:uncharacterized protein involved in exopolysaccharide biosynthesis